MSGYELSRKWFDWSFENPEKVRPIHTAIFFFAVEHCNRLGWKDKFGFPSQMTMDALGIKSYNTYTRALSELSDFGFITFIQKSKNQYSANIISLSATSINDKALDKAFIKHTTKQSDSTSQSTVSIDKPITSKPITNIYGEIDFLNDWNKIRYEILNKPSNQNRIGRYSSKADFKELQKIYKAEDFKQAIEALMRQQQMPNGNESMRTDPKHLLENFERYVAAYADKNTKLYGEKKKVDRL